MPEQNTKPRGAIVRLSQAHEWGMLIRVRCGYCRTTKHYFPDDLRKILGDIDCEIIDRRMKCEGCGKGEYIDARGASLTGAEKNGLRVRRLVAIKVKKVPVWRDEAL